MEVGDSSEIEVLIKLEEHFRKPVFVFIYNPLNEKGIAEKDELYIRWFIENVIRKKNIRDCTIILNGFGGDLKTALLSSQILRDNLNYYACFVPSVIGSSLVYFALQSNKLILGEKSILTQIDPIFEYKGETLRAIKNLSNLDVEIRTRSQKIINYNMEILKRILKRGKLLDKGCFSKENEINNDELERIVHLFMGKKFHESGLKVNDLSRLKINKRIENEDIIKITNELIRKCRDELFSMSDYNRLVILTNEGGYFFE